MLLDLTMTSTTSSIFVSYRRAEGLVEARAVYERLRAEFGHDRVFIDLEGLAYGVDFVEVLEEQLRHCQVLLALIGRDWFGRRSGSSDRRIDDENDFVRLELRTALGRAIRVVPVLINGAAMPHSSELPEDLRSLVRRHALDLDFKRFDADLSRLVAALRPILSNAQPQIPVGADQLTRALPLVRASSRRAPKAGTTAIRGQHVANVNTSEQSGAALRAAIVSKLPNATNVQAIPTATINFGSGSDAVQKFQYQLTFTSDTTVPAEEFTSAVGPLIVDLNSYSTPGDA